MRVTASTFRIGFSLAVLIVGTQLRADDKPNIPEGYKIVHLQSGADVLVKKQADPLAKVHGDSGNSAMRLFSSTNAMADKKFTPNTSPVSKDSPLTDREKGAYATTSYRGMPRADSSTNGFNTKYNTSSSLPTDSRHPSEFNRPFVTPASSLDLAKPYSASKASEDQGRSAILGKGKTDVYASNMSNKQYLGPGAQKVPKDEENGDHMGMTLDHIPNRPLTVDEVRELINHGIVPDTNDKPGDQSKALNDPTYQPEPEPERVPHALLPPVVEEDKDFPVPSPGTMAQPPPENTEKLPQH